MPHRLVSLAILIFWVVAAVTLFSRDILPTLLIGAPPDLRSVTRVDDRERKTSWSILVMDDARGVNLRAVGKAVTKTVRKKDGYVHFSSDAKLDSGALFKGTPLATAEGDQLDIFGTFEIDSAGNLYHFHVGVRDRPPPSPELLNIEGQLEENSIQVRAKGPIPSMSWNQRLDYRPRGMVQNAMGPLDRMPGLHVGQRWSSQVVSPLTAQVHQATVAVTRQSTIYWDEKPVTTLEVVTSAPFLSTKTWVRPDGLVLRQEVPFPFAKVILERIPDPENDPQTGQDR